MAAMTNKFRLERMALSSLMLFTSFETEWKRASN
jgi:hypothetical protein